MDGTWTLAELVAEVARALPADLEPPNGQIRALPDERAVRYYTTLGLLDRPAAMRGRTALYGRRHLAQVVAIKRLQAEGKSLAEIQGVLTALDDAALAKVSGVAVPARQRQAARADFWREPPAAVADRAGAPEPAVRAEGFVRQLALAVAPGVTLTIDADREPTDADADALRAAAAPLLAELRRRRLVP